MNKRSIFSFVAFLVMVFANNAFAGSPFLQDNERLAGDIDRLIQREAFHDIRNEKRRKIIGTSSTSQNSLAGSSDLNSLLPESGWLTTSYTNITNDSIGYHIDSDTYQITGGIDKRLNDWIVGLSTTYAYTEKEIPSFGIGSQGDVNSFLFTPYIAYIINQHFFISGITSYTYTRDEPDAPGASVDTHASTTELTVNGHTTMGQWTFVGLTGARYNHGELTSDIPFFGKIDTNRDDWTYLVEMQIGYSLDQHVKGLRIHAETLYEYLDSDTDEDDGVLYISGGFDYSVNKDFILGLNYSHDANNEDLDISRVEFNASLDF